MNISSSTVTINKKIAYICIWLIKIIMLLVFVEHAREEKQYFLWFIVLWNNAFFFTVIHTELSDLKWKQEGKILIDRILFICLLFLVH